MASASVSELVIFIAAVSVAAAVSGALVTTVGDISDSVDERGADVASDLDTDIEIISNPGSGAVYDDGADDVRLLVKNTGRRQISTSGSTVDVLIDGQYIERSSYSITVINGSEWDDGSVVRIVVDEPLSTGDHQATVIVRSERETLRFRV
ncbi:fla cluster protein flaG [Halorientalis litorea]|jgi:flagellar protein FlaG|uniref:fla cluster protein flaG n=1 Tax=Halorientalis litorea TaxID=2931977 RepID=UPI001FF57B3E|nr:fla cluster protein flaG [Halorientalis litorea]